MDKEMTTLKNFVENITYDSDFSAEDYYSISEKVYELIARECKGKHVGIHRYKKILSYCEIFIENCSLIP